jgi:hypothetical protein
MKFSYNWKHIFGLFLNNFNDIVVDGITGSKLLMIVDLNLKLFFFNLLI